jgi:hypothetical protein
VPVAEGDDVQPVVAGEQRVPFTAGEVDDAVAFADLVHAHVARGAELLPGPAASAEDVEDLLFRALDVRGGRPAAGIDLDPVDAEPGRAGGSGEVGPRTGEVTHFGAVGFRFVPVGNQVRILTRISGVVEETAEPTTKGKGVSEWIFSGSS